MDPNNPLFLLFFNLMAFLTRKIVSLSFIRGYRSFICVSILICAIVGVSRASKKNLRPFVPREVNFGVRLL